MDLFRVDSEKQPQRQVKLERSRSTFGGQPGKDPPKPNRGNFGDGEPGPRFGRPGGPPGDPGQKAFFIAVFHPRLAEKDFFQKEFLRSVQVLANSGQPVQAQLVSLGNVAVIEVKGKQDSDAMVRLNGKQGFLVSKAPPSPEDRNKITTYLERSLEAGTLLTSQRVLRLSFLSSRMPDLDFNWPPNASFALFYAVVLAKMCGVRVRRLEFCNPDCKQITGVLSHIKDLISSLKEIELARPMVFPQKLKDEMDRCGIKVLDKTPDPEARVKQSDGWTWAPDEPPCVTVSGYAPPLRLDMFTPVQFDLKEAATHGVIVEFFRCAWESLAEIGRFYLPQSVFSTTVNVHGPGPLAHFDKYSRTVNGIDENRLVGGADIAAGQNEMFRGHFYACPTGYQCSCVAPGVVCYTLQGVFQFQPEVVLGFDRTMVVLAWEGNWVVANDHVFVRMPCGN